MSRIKVLVVDDSVVVRRLVSDALSADPDVEVIGVAQNGQIGVVKAKALKPDLITMDIEMPVKNGIEAVREIRAAGLRMPIVMFSTLTSHGAAATLDALSAGATDYVTKPTHVGRAVDAVDVIGEQLLPKVKGLVAVKRRSHHRAAPTKAHTGPSPKVLAIGSSTGGPEALSRVIKGLTRPLPMPALIVQHMPPLFTTQLAQRLDRLGPNTVIEAQGGEPLTPGTIYLAPGDFHLEVAATGRGPVTRISQGDQVNFCRPAVDVLFRSVSAAFGAEVLAVVLTGMGSDGREGSRTISAAGGRIVVQDEESSVVWGMPGSVASEGLAHSILPLSEIAGAIAGRPLSRTIARAVTA